MNYYGLNWQCCFLVAPKRPQFLFFFNCHGCQTFVLYEIHCHLSPPKSWHNNSFLDSVQHKAQGVLLFLKIASSTLCLSTIRNAVQNPDDYFGGFWFKIPVDYKKHFTNFQGYISFVNVIICTHLWVHNNISKNDCAIFGSKYPWIQKKNSEIYLNAKQAS